MFLKLPSGKTRKFCAFENRLLGKWNKEFKNYLNHNFIIGRFLENISLENGFEANLSSKTSVLSVWKGFFSGFWKFLSEKVETVFWESEAKRSKLSKWKFGHRKLLRKWLWS